MQAYKISESEAIFLPSLMPHLYSRDVELFIIPKRRIHKKQVQKVLFLAGQVFSKIQTLTQRKPSMNIYLKNTK